MDRNRDTLERLGAQTSIPIPGLGKIFWAKSYSHKELAPPEWSSFKEFNEWMDRGWITHYAIPDSGCFDLIVTLDHPLSDDIGFENAFVTIDWLMGQISSDYTRDWDQTVKLDDLRCIPKELVMVLRQLLLKFKGDWLMCHYCTLPEDGNPLEIDIRFNGCREINLPTDKVLELVAEEIKKALPKK
jgi:hypothetical protein